MRYSVAHLTYSFPEDWQQDVFQQSLGDLGFDTFDGNDAYIPTAALQANKQAIDALIAQTEGVEIVSLQDCPNEDWNATWEEEHPIEELPLGVHIKPRCAFGNGHHETTGMLIEALLDRSNAFHKVLDMGCGTGVLGIIAKKCGATEVCAVDIDENSVRNAQENAELNNVQLDIRLGDTPPEGEYDLILANIHRNIILEQLPAYTRSLLPNGEIWVSGFYAEDIPVLIDKAQQLGLNEVARKQKGNWCMLQLKR